METKRVRLYIDVDGCINASMADQEWGDELQVGKASPDGGYSYTIHWSQQMVDDLSLLDVDIVWLTTWCEAAPVEIGGLTGFGRSGRVLRPNDGGPVTFPSIEWKTRALVRDQKEDPSPFIWVDDEMRDYMNELLAMDEVYGPFLLVKPDPDLGISRHLMVAMYNFIMTNFYHDPDGLIDLDHEHDPVDPE